MAEIWFVIILIWAMELFVFLLLFVALWSESVFFNWLFTIYVARDSWMMLCFLPYL